jgi:hypothetical protein
MEGEQFRHTQEREVNEKYREIRINRLKKGNIQCIGKSE